MAWLTDASTGEGTPHKGTDGAAHVVDANIGAKADVRATWFDSVASVVSLLKLAIAVFVSAGSHVYTYTNGKISTDAWTLLGTTRTKTYSYNTDGTLASVTDWV